MGKHSGPARTGEQVAIPWRALGIVGFCLLAWVALVWFAISMGSEARAGDRTALALLVVATIGAMACLFLALLQGLTAWSRLSQRRATPADSATSTPEIRPTGGRRVKR